MPMFSNICREKRGKLAATIDRQKVFAAMADAALLVRLASNPVSVEVIRGNLQHQVGVNKVVE
jgi:hypothetical protein